MRFSLSSSNEAAVCVGMVRGLQMGIQWRKGKQTRTVVRVDGQEEGEGTAPDEGVQWEVGAEGMGRPVLRDGPHRLDRGR